MKERLAELGKACSRRDNPIAYDRRVDRARGGNTQGALSIGDHVSLVAIAFCCTSICSNRRDGLPCRFLQLRDDSFFGITSKSCPGGMALAMG